MALAIMCFWSICLHAISPEFILLQAEGVPVREETIGETPLAAWG
jgi:hypothetical protein